MRHRPTRLVCSSATNCGLDPRTHTFLNSPHCVVIFFFQLPQRTGSYYQSFINAEPDVSVSAQLAVKSIVSLVRLPPKKTTSIKMKHLAAYLLLGLAGNEAPTVNEIKEVLGSVGIDADVERLEKLISELKGKDLQELIAEGSSKLASVPSAGAAAAAPAGGAAPAADAPKEEPKEDEEESDEDMGFGLFD